MLAMRLLSLTLIFLLLWSSVCHSSVSSVDAAAYSMRASPQSAQRSEQESRPNQDRSLALFSDIFFGRNNATVGELAAAILDGATHELPSKPDYRIVVDGHADAAEAPGIALRRAEVERAYLVHARGLAPERVIVRRFRRPLIR